MCCTDRCIWDNNPRHGLRSQNWKNRPINRIKKGTTLVLMFDSTKETLSVFINGVLCGIMADRLNDKYCWGIVLKQKGVSM